MTHEELLAEINKQIEFAEFEDACGDGGWPAGAKALRAVVELHKPNQIPDWVPTEKEFICGCSQIYPCLTIQAIEKELG